MSYATALEVTNYAAVLGVTPPAVSFELLEAASRDIDRLCGRRNIPVDALAGDARGALSRAVCAQVIFRLEQGPESVLGADDGLAAVAGVSFSLRPAPRWSPLAHEELVGFGLLSRHGTVAPDPAPTRTAPLT